MSSTTLTPARTERIAAGRLPRATLLAAAVSAAANLAVFFAAGALGADLTGPFMGPGGPTVALSPVQVVLASAVPAVAGALVLWLLGRFARRPATVFLGAAAVLGLLSLASPLTLPITGGARLTLAAMHVVASAAIAGLLVSQTRERA